MSVEIEHLDLFGLGRMWWQGKPLRECLTDQARFDAGDRALPALELGATGCPNSRLVIEVAPDAAGRWWAGYFWHCWHVPAGTTNGTATPIDTVRGSTREEAIARAAAECLRHLPTVEKSKAARILDAWRRELAALAAPEASDHA